MYIKRIKIMKRYQLYLNPHSVSILDDLGKNIDLRRSRILQVIIDSIASNFARILAATKTPPKDTYVLDSLVGAIKLGGKKKTNFAQDIDEIYLKD